MRDGNKCINPDCKCKADHHKPPICYVLTVHHARKRSQGGQDVPENVVTLCNYCHDMVESHKIDDGFVSEYLQGIYGDSSKK